MPYIGTQPKDVRSFGKVQFDFTATQGQTAFTGADDDGKTLGFTEGQIQVYVNGILMDASDYTTSNTNTVTLVSAANLNDIITVVALQTDIPNSDYVPISGGTFTGDVTFSGSITGDVLVGVTETASSGLAVATGKNITFSENNINTSYANIFRQSNSGAAVLAQGYKYTSTANKMASSLSSSWAKSAIGAYSGQIRFYTDPASSDAINTDLTPTERMRVDSAGRITTPYQPSFQVKLNTDANVGTGAYVTGWNEIYDTGQNFANDRFTAPVAGKYLIAYSGLHNTGSGYYGRAYLYKNGGYVFDGLGDQQTYGSYQRVSWSIIVDLAASDYLQIYANSNNSSHYVYNHYTHWSGHLLG